MISTRLITYLVFIGSINNVLNSIVCNEERNETQCETNSQYNAMSCAGGLPGTGETRNIESLTLCDWKDEDFQPAVLLYFPNIDSFSLLRSPVRQIVNEFHEYPALKKLNISYNEIEYLSSMIFLKLRSLAVLDLRYNKLHQFDPSSISGLDALKNVYLFGNQWHCNRDFMWIIHQNNTVQSVITDIDLLMCNHGPMHKNKPLKQVMIMQKNLETECAGISCPCNCTLDHIVRIGNSLRPMITVNCSYQNLKVLPSNLPNFTSTLVVKGNSISNLDPFIDDEKYLNLLNVYLDYNNISSIKILEASSWLLTFRALSLRGNKLSEVPVYVLEHVFEKNLNIGQLVLSENPWKCDCTFTPHFKDFLAKYRNVIEDVENVRCAARDKDKNSLSAILSLSRNKICHENSVSRISGLNILNICMAVLLVLVLCDFMYNYFMYKKYGQLPWIANKLP